jgi:lipid A ethanolaminephosphotransferase
MRRNHLHNRTLPPWLPALATALALALGYNLPLWRRLLALPGVSLATAPGFLIATGIVLTAIFFAFFSLLSYPRILKPVLILALFLAAPIAWFSASYGIVIDCHMISNILETDLREAGELITAGYLLYLFCFALLPALVIARLRLNWRPAPRQTVGNLLLAFAALLTAGGAVYLNYSSFVLFGREHRDLRMFINPTYALYSAGKYYRQLHPEKVVLKAVAVDARIDPRRPPAGRHRLGLMVVGESARASEFSLNGYPRPTNPELARETAISFTRAYASATSTAEALPCMFSRLRRSDYSVKKAAAEENLLDILKRVGVAVYWRDNNSSSKGVARRVAYRKIAAADVPAGRRPELIVNGEIYDEALLCGLPEIISQNPRRDILIVLHQKGSHGPAYYKRHPEKFTRFRPEYRGPSPQSAPRRELVNAYDNTILYSDWFLARCIRLLQGYAPRYNTFMFYMSDHGESLGEKGIYLHGLPWLMAPDEQKHIGAVVWLSDGLARALGVSPAELRETRNRQISHDWIFSSLLRLYGVETKAYEPQLDLFAVTRSPARQTARDFSAKFARRATKAVY